MPDDNSDPLKTVEERLNFAWSEIVKMEERLKALPGQIDSFNQSMDQVTKLLDAPKEAISKINEHYNDYFSKPDPTKKSKLETVLEHHTTISQAERTLTEVVKELDSFKEFVDGNQALSKPGIKTQFIEYFESLKHSNKEVLKERKEAYDTLYRKIEGLLPGATATGLSKAYQEQKNNYKLPVILWSVLFTLTVGGMMAFGIIYYAESENFQDTIRHILARLPFFIPAIWLAIFASRQQSQYKRLQQEYVYKETLSKSYEAYKREIDKLPDSAIKDALHEKLIASMVEMCGYNPSLTLENKSHEDKPPMMGDFLKSLKGLAGKSKSKIEVG